MSTAALFEHGWTPDAWRTRRAAQQPDWPDTAALEDVLAQVRRLPPLVFAGEARTLTDSLAAAHSGDAFLLVAGDCAESFEAFSADSIRDKLKVILQMSVVLTYGSGVPTIKVGRMASSASRAPMPPRPVTVSNSRASAATPSTTPHSKPSRDGPIPHGCCARTTSPRQL